jgi:hypothetical protein
MLKNDLKNNKRKRNNLIKKYMKRRLDRFRKWKREKQESSK